MRDRNGVLWFGTVKGVSCLVPEQNDSLTLPPIRIVAVRIAGVPYPMGENGASELTLPDLRAGQNQIQVDFGGITFATGDTLRYQYWLEGLDRQWSPPSAQ